MLASWSRRIRALSPQTRANVAAAMLATGAALILQLEGAPRVAGSDRPLKPTTKPVLHLARAQSAPVMVASITAAKPSLDQALAEHPSISDVPATAVPSAAPANSTYPEDSLTDLSPAEQLVALKMRLMRKGAAFLQKIPDYTAQFTKQELVEGELLEEQVIQLKVRHEPFSVYLKWATGDCGREVLYVDGCNDGKMLVHLGGWKARLPAVWLEPGCDTAMAECRHPVTRAGILELAKTIVEHHLHDLQHHTVSRCEQLADQEFDGRMCTGFVTEFISPELSPIYRKSICLIDKEWNVPLLVTNYSWLTENAAEVTGEELDELTLIENYSFTDVRFRQSLIAADFERNNSEYAFR